MHFSNKEDRFLLRDDPILKLSGDLVAEVCDVCGNETTDFIIVNGNVVCKDCAESLEIERSLLDNSEKCEICGWPINKRIKEEEAEKMIRQIVGWVEEQNPEVSKKVEKILRKYFVGKGDLKICRYDFFYFIYQIIKSLNKKIGRKFKKRFVSTYDFKGSLIS